VSVVTRSLPGTYCVLLGGQYRERAALVLWLRRIGQELHRNRQAGQCPGNYA